MKVFKVDNKNILIVFQFMASLWIVNFTFLHGFIKQFQKMKLTKKNAISYRVFGITFIYLGRLIKRCQVNIANIWLARTIYAVCKLAKP